MTETASAAGHRGCVARRADRPSTGEQSRHRPSACPRGRRDPSQSRRCPMGMTFISLNAAAGKNPEEYGTEPVRYDEMIPGCWKPKRVSSTWTSTACGGTVLPVIPRIRGTSFLDGKDKDFSTLCMQTRNDFDIDDVVRGRPGPTYFADLAPASRCGGVCAGIERMAARVRRPSPFPRNCFHSVFLRCTPTTGTPSSRPQRRPTRPCRYLGTSGKAPFTASEAPFADRLPCSAPTRCIP
jgi:hypothetical protein